MTEWYPTKSSKIIALAANQRPEMDPEATATPGCNAEIQLGSQDWKQTMIRRLKQLRSSEQSHILSRIWGMRISSVGARLARDLSMLLIPRCRSLGYLGVVCPGFQITVPALWVLRRETLAPRSCETHPGGCVQETRAPVWQQCLIDYRKLIT